MPAYPEWRFYPLHLPEPSWVHWVVGAFDGARNEIDSRKHHGVSSDTPLAAIRQGLETKGFQVETGKTAVGKIMRPVLFGDQGRPRVSYEVDAYHPGERVVVEVEAGRGAANNADYRDLIRASLMVDADYLALAMMLSYTAGKAAPIRSYGRTKDRVDAIYASERLHLPLKGILLIGY